MRVLWGKTSRGKQWHAYVFFDGYDTRGGVCMPAGKSVPDELSDGPGDPGMENVCRDCMMGVRGMQKRYAPSPSPCPTPTEERG